MASSVGSAALHDLRRGAIGFYGSLFQSISGMGLLLDVGAIFIPVFAIAGQYAPLSVLLGFLFSLLLVNTTYIFSQRYPSSGGYIKFISSVFGRRAGKALGWLYCAYTFAVLPNIAIFLGMIYVPSLIELSFPGVHVTPFDSFGIMSIVVLAVTVVVLLGIKPTARFVIIAGIAELTILVSLSVTVWHQTGYTLDSAPFLPGAGAIGAVGAGALFALLMFAGSGSPVMLGDEIANPSRNISRSIILSVTTAGLLLLFTAYVFDVKLGQGVHSLSGSYLPSIAVSAGSLFGVFVSVFVITSSVSLAVSFLTGFSRGVYFMSKNGLMMHPYFGRLSASRRVPYAVVLLAGFLSLATASLTTYLFGPYTAFLLLITTVTVGFATIHTVVNVALIADGTMNRNAFKHLALPLLSSATLISVLALTLLPGTWTILVPVAFLFLLSASVLAISKLRPEKTSTG